MKHYADVRTPADPEDFETTQWRSALPPVEFSASTGATATTFTITDRQYPPERGPTVSYRVYFLPKEYAPSAATTALQRVAGQRVASLVAEVKAPGRGSDLTVTDSQFYGQQGYYYCVGVSRQGIEAPPEHFVRAR